MLVEELYVNTKDYSSLEHQIRVQRHKELKESAVTTNRLISLEASSNSQDCYKKIHSRFIHSWYLALLGRNSLMVNTAHEKNPETLKNIQMQFRPHVF